MNLVEILMALAIIQVWGRDNPLHRDGWFLGCAERLKKVRFMERHWSLPMAVSLAFPTLLTLLLFLVLPGWLALIAGALILLYSLGRGEFATGVNSYVKACSEGVWDDAILAAEEQGVDHDPVRSQDWPRLHECMLQATAYQGFERLFAVLFWFVVFGPAGALLYRLSFLYATTFTSSHASRWLWAIEWLPARLLGVSFAVTGNFVGCLNRWKAHLLHASLPNDYVLMQSALGALSVDDELVQSCDVTQREVAALKRLYTRTLWFWLACLAIVTIAG